MERDQNTAPQYKMKKKLLYFLSISAILSVVCILAQIAYIITKTFTKFDKLNLTIIVTLYLVEIANVSM